MFTNNFGSSIQKPLKPEKKSLGHLNSSRCSEEDTDLINLFGDFDISTQAGKVKETKIDDLQIKELEKFLSNAGSSNLQRSCFTTEQEKEFQNFFDKYECKAKEDILTDKNEIEKNKEAVLSTLFMNNSNLKASKVLTPKINQEQIEESFEDLIDEVLLEKNLMKQRLLNSTKIHYCNNEKINLNKSKPASPLYDSKNGHTIKSDIMEQIILNNNITFSSSKVNDKDDTNNVLLTKKKIPKYSKAEVKEMVFKYNLTYLEAIKMDEKAFKRSILKSEAEKRLLTPGPTLHNKSIVLPQIMKRLADRKKIQDEQTNITRKLVLDTGSSHCKLVEENAISAISDDNPSGKTNNLTEKANLQSRVTQSALVSASNSDKILTNFNKLKNNQAPVTFGSKNNQSITAKNAGIHANSRFVHIDKLKALRKETISAEEIKDPMMVGGKILRPPQSLMTDCNKTRFVVNATSQLFKDFVNGNY